MLEDRNKEYFEDAFWVTEKMGLHPLMKMSHQYNIELIHQFFATLVFGNTPDIPMTWMSGDDVCHSNFVEFATILGYPFDPAGPSGKRMHISGVIDKRQLAPSTTQMKWFLGKLVTSRTSTTSFFACSATLLPPKRATLIS